jgi:hypothetical protein
MQSRDTTHTGSKLSLAIVLAVTLFGPLPFYGEKQRVRYLTMFGCLGSFLIYKNKIIERADAVLFYCSCSDPFLAHY